MLDRIDHDGALIIGEWQRRQARIAAFDAEPVAQHNLQMAAYRVSAKRVIKALVISDALAGAFLAPSRCLPQTPPARPVCITWPRPNTFIAS